VKPCELRGLLRQIVYIDLLDRDEISAKEILVSAVKGVRLKPSLEPIYPGNSRDVNTIQPQYPGKTPSARVGKTRREGKKASIRQTRQSSPRQQDDLTTIENRHEGRDFLKYCGRCGDDTFYAVVSRKETQEVIAWVRILLKRIKNHPWHKLMFGLYVTCSIGLAEYRKDEDPQNTINRAVEGLREAKSLGGNTVRNGPYFLHPNHILKWEKALS
jgi:hypothetical protein